jgi:hypothetical protein
MRHASPGVGSAFFDETGPKTTKTAQFLRTILGKNGGRGNLRAFSESKKGVKKRNRNLQFFTSFHRLFTSFCTGTCFYG